MSDYPAIFHLRVCRAKAELEGLTSLLERMHEACQRKDDGTYDDLESVDSESLEKLEILSKSIASECYEAKRAMQSQIGMFL